MKIKLLTGRSVAKFHFLLLFFLSSSTGGFDLFLIGDSVDRYTIIEWCDLKSKGCENANCTDWVRNVSIIGPPAKHNGNLHCRIGDDSITYSLNCGSSPRGPYQKGYCPPSDPFGATTVLIPRLIGLYFDRIGVPDLVVYHSALWDIQYLYQKNGIRMNQIRGDLSTPLSNGWNASLAEFENNLNGRVSDIERSIASNVVNKSIDMSSRPGGISVGLRTAVANRACGPLLRGFNGIIRKTAVSRNLTLYDFDSDVWSSVDWDIHAEHQYKIFRDHIHPSTVFVQLAAEKLLGGIFSSNLIARGSALINKIFPPILVDVSGLLPLHPNHRPWRRVLAIQNPCNATDPRDRYFSSSNFVRNNITLAVDDLLNPTLCGNDVYLIDYVKDSISRNISLLLYGPVSRSLQIAVKLSPGDILPFPPNKLAKVTRSKPTIKLAREQGARDVFVIVERRRHLVPSALVMQLNNWSFDQVKVVVKGDKPIPVGFSSSPLVDG
jgi:hypothetical protein